MTEPAARPLRARRICKGTLRARFRRGAFLQSSHKAVLRFRLKRRVCQLSVNALRLHQVNAVYGFTKRLHRSRLRVCLDLPRKRDMRAILAPFWLEPCGCERASQRAVQIHQRLARAYPRPPKAPALSPEAADLVEAHVERLEPSRAHRSFRGCGLPRIAVAQKRERKVQIFRRGEAAACRASSSCSAASLSFVSRLKFTATNKRKTSLLMLAC